MQELDISILMPCLNEAETLACCIAEAWSAITETGLTGEVLVADNGSTDGSIAIAENAGARVVHVSEKGYGNALSAGIQAAYGRYVLMGDADGSYDFTELPGFLEKLYQGSDLVIGCRFPRCGGRIHPGAMPWKHRWIGNPVLSFLGRLFFSSPVDDFHCGLRAFRRDALVELGLKTAGMEFASEMVVKASLSGLRITQIPIVLRKDGRSRPPHLRSWRDGWRHLRFMLLYSPLWLFILPGLLMTVVGGAGFILLLPEPLLIGRVTFDLSTLLVSSTCLFVGVQLFGFGLFIKAYAVTTGLLPGKEIWLKLVKGKPVEWGIALGLVFILAGTGYLIHATLLWKAAAFGPMPYQTILRRVIASITAIGLGIQAMVYGFALAVIGLER
jgi:glycosyltransferase involved in cell wall biosynthesis